MGRLALKPFIGNCRANSRKKVIAFVYLEYKQLGQTRTKLYTLSQEHPTALFGEISVRKTI